MYLSRVDLNYDQLPLTMLNKLDDSAIYALHQWLWQLFPAQSARHFLFRQEEVPNGRRCYLLSAEQPVPHNLLQVASKPFQPRLSEGERLHFSLRANPVITRQQTRADVLMDAKFHAPPGLTHAEIWQRQQDAAIAWLTRQGTQKGFHCQPDEVTVSGYQQHRLSKPQGGARIRFSSVDLQGTLTVTDPTLFLTGLAAGYGKSRGLGCGLMLIKRT